MKQILLYLEQLYTATYLKAYQKLKDPNKAKMIARQVVDSTSKWMV
jgi:uncharacterized protein (UPF0254 family)